MNVVQLDKVVEGLYSEVTDELIDVIQNPNIDDFITILHLVNQIATMTEITTIGNKPLRGKDKREIVKKLCRILLEEFSHESIKDSILVAYDKNIDSAIDIMINFAKNNKVISKTKSFCFC
tara:strand:+ start:1749 stop:2111 length:363 start_codon:yes stop_codon:yes gene_type:complete